MTEENYTEQYNGIILLRKGKVEDEDVWFATVGKQLVSDGVKDQRGANQQSGRPKPRNNMQDDCRSF